MTPTQLAILQHSVGADKFGRREKTSRNYFVTQADGSDRMICRELVALGFMHDYGNQGELTDGGNLYRVTGDGINAMLADSPSPPKMTRRKRMAKERYERFLNWCDAFGGTFLEFLKSKDSRA